MNTQQLGNSDMNITAIGFGAWAIGGGDWGGGWGAQDDDESIAAIHRALELGINWIDTAAIYGLGHSEEVVGKALKGRSERPYVFTKCSLVWDENRETGASLKGDSIRREVESSLSRLQTDVIDLYQIHWPNPDEQIEEGWSTMADLQKEGKVRWIGVSNFSVEQMERAQRIAPITSLQPPYSMIRRDIEADILPYCQDNNVGVIVYSPMASGILTGKMTPERVSNMPDDDWRKGSDDFQDPKLSEHLQLVEVLTKIGERDGRSSAEVAIAWTLRHPAVTAAIVGSRRPDQIEGVVGAADYRLNDSDLVKIEEALAQQTSAV